MSAAQTATAGPGPGGDPAVAGEDRRRTGVEVLLVLGLSLGASAVYAVVNLVQIATAPGGVSRATATLNGSRATSSVFDLVYQLLSIGFAVLPVGLALFLLGSSLLSPPRAGASAAAAGGGAPGDRSAARRIGLRPADRARGARDAGWGALIAAAIGVPGLGLYAAGRALGVTAHVQASGLAEHWWTVPVLVLSAAQNALLEEVVVVAYLLDRLPRLRWSPVAVVVASALLRGSYHLYQGYGPFVGNAVMGVVFCLWYRRTHRVLPLVVAHTLLDVVAFVGYQFLAGPLHLR